MRDFRPSHDLLDLSTLGFTDLGDVWDAAHNRGWSTVIQTSDTGSIRLDGVRLWQLDGDASIFDGG